MTEPPSYDTTGPLAYNYPEMVRLVESGGTKSGIEYQCPKCGWLVKLPEDVGETACWCPGSIRGMNPDGIHGQCMMHRVKDSGPETALRWLFRKAQ